MSVSGVNGKQVTDEVVKKDSPLGTTGEPKVNVFTGKIIESDVVAEGDGTGSVSQNIESIKNTTEATRLAMEDETSQQREFSMTGDIDDDIYIDKNTHMLKDTIVVGKMPIRKGELKAIKDYKQFLEDAKWIGDWEAANEAKLYEMNGHAGAKTPLKHKTIKNTPLGEIVISGNEIRIKKEYPEGKEVELKSIGEKKTVYALYEKQEKVTEELQRVLENVKYDDIKGEYVYTEPKSQASSPKKKKVNISDAMWLNGVSVIEAADTQLAGGFTFDRASGYVISGRDFYIVDETTHTIRKVPEGKEGRKERRKIEDYLYKHPEASVSDNGKTFMAYAAEVRHEIEQKRRTLAQN